LAWQSYAKFAIHEGFHDWPVPSFAVRGAVSYLTGTNQVGMTVTSLDLLISKRFGLLKTARLEPLCRLEPDFDLRPQWNSRRNTLV